MSDELKALRAENERLRRENIELSVIVRELVRQRDASKRRCDGVRCQKHMTWDEYDEQRREFRRWEQRLFGETFGWMVSDD